MCQGSTSDYCDAHFITRLISLFTDRDRPVWSAILDGIIKCIRNKIFLNSVELGETVSFWAGLWTWLSCVWMCRKAVCTYECGAQFVRFVCLPSWERFEFGAVLNGSTYYRRHWLSDVCTGGGGGWNAAENKISYGNTEDFVDWNQDKDKFF